MSLQKGELQIRDLLIKLQVITNGLIEERKRSQEFLSRLKVYDESLKQKESENLELTKAKIDLLSKLSIERSKKAPNKKGMATNVVADLEEKVNKQAEEIKSLNQQLMENKESNDQENMKQNMMIAMKDNEINKLKQELEKEKNKNPDDELKKIKGENDELNKKINNLKNELTKEKIKNADEQINKYANEIKINDINSNINTLFITQSEKEYNNMKYNSYNLLKSNNILQNFNLIDFLNKKHNISQIKISSSSKEETEKFSELGKKRKDREEEKKIKLNEFKSKAKDMK